MTDKERKAKNASYGEAHQKLVGALESYPREMWKYRPAADQWSIHEIIVHIADSEANSYIRCRRFLAEPGEDLMAYDQNQWASQLNYHDQSPEDALELFRLLRKKSFDLVKDAPDEVWTDECFHPELGTTTLKDWLDTYERHIPEHVEQMQAVFDRWQESD